MNVFVLDFCPTLAAQAHCDRHCGKLILESAQLISTALRVCGIDYGYKLAYQNHPCAVWCRKSVSNFEWLRQLGLELGKEFTHRYGTIHKSVEVIRKAPKLPVDDVGLTPFYQAVVTKYPDPVQAYRIYYRTEKYSKGLIQYTNREPPKWLSMVFSVAVKKSKVVYTATGYSQGQNEYNWSK